MTPFPDQELSTEEGRGARTWRTDLSLSKKYSHLELQIPDSLQVVLSWLTL